MRLKREMNSTSSQDEFAKWAKLRRQHDKVVAEYEDKCIFPHLNHTFLHQLPQLIVHQHKSSSPPARPSIVLPGCFAGWVQMAFASFFNFGVLSNRFFGYQKGGYRGTGNGYFRFLEHQWGA